jgi:uncharacterized membrane protein
LFEKKDIVDVGAYNGVIVSTKADFLKLITDNYKKNYFTHNAKYFVIGIILSILTMFFLATMDGIQTLVTISGMSIWLSVWSFGVAFMIYNIFKLWISGHKFMSIFNLIFSIPFLMGELFALYVVYSSSSFGFVVMLVLLIILNISFYFLLKQYTETGLRLVEEIKGFKLFLSVTEKERMNFHNPPERTPELFEKYLPYALALGVENKWAEQFADIFRDKDMMDSHPLWYSSSIYSKAFISDFGNSFSSSISASSTVPGSNSGGGGGGSSGGGGGGGGGGGW